MSTIMPGKFDGSSEYLTHFYAIPEEDRERYNEAVKGLNGALCPPANREIYYSEFESRLLRPADPAVYKWELEQAL